MITLMQANPCRLRSTDGRVEIWDNGSSSGPTYKIEVDGVPCGPMTMGGEWGCESMSQGEAWLSAHFGGIGYLGDPPSWWRPSRFDDAPMVGQ